MIDVAVQSIRWGDVGERRNSLSERFLPAFDALKEFANEPVHLVSAPYGTRLIRHGMFNWPALGSDGGIRDEYRGGLVPLGLVISGAIELYTISASTVTVRRHDRGVQRTVPMFMLGAGEFFGLFETFATSFSQPELNGDAGGTTLVVLPHIGDKEKFSTLKNTDTGMYRQGKNNNQKFSIKNSDIDHLQIIEGSSLAFGQLFSGLLAQIDCPWRAQLILFPTRFVDGIRRKAAAHQALLEATIAQLSLTCVRMGLEKELDKKVRQTEKNHVLGVSMIAHGYRPGFVGVVESELDEAVLPSKHIHQLMYDLDVFEPITLAQSGSANTGSRFFPSIFRPSFALEPSLYFLKRPHFLPSNDRSSVQEKLDEIISQCHEHTKRKAGFRSLNGQQLQTMLKEQHPGAEQAKICLGSSAFLTGGCIAITPIND